MQYVNSLERDGKHMMYQHDHLLINGVGWVIEQQLFAAGFKFTAAWIFNWNFVFVTNVQHIFNIYSEALLTFERRREAIFYLVEF